MARQSDRIEQLRDLVRETQEMHEVALAQVYSRRWSRPRKLRSRTSRCPGREMLTLREQLQRAQDRSVGAEVAHARGSPTALAGAAVEGAAEAGKQARLERAPVLERGEAAHPRGIAEELDATKQGACPRAPPNSGRSMFRLGLRRGSSASDREPGGAHARRRGAGAGRARRSRAPNGTRSSRRGCAQRPPLNCWRRVCSRPRQTGRPAAPAEAREVRARAWRCRSTPSRLSDTRAARWGGSSLRARAGGDRETCAHALIISAFFGKRPVLGSPLVLWVHA